jgi:hypothetical protein
MKFSIRYAVGAAAFSAIFAAATPTLACHEDGFGSCTPVNLPRDKHPSAGKDSGIPVANIPHARIPEPRYFRPK